MESALSKPRLGYVDKWRLKLLKAEINIWQGRNAEAVELLEKVPGTQVLPQSLEARRMVLIGSAEGSLQNLQAADQALSRAKALNQPASSETTSKLLLAEGKVAAIRGQFDIAESHFRAGLAQARDSHLALAEASALNNLGMVNMRRKRYADATDCFSTSFALASAKHQAVLYVATTGNLGWSYLEMGDLERAEYYFEKAEGLAERTGATGVQLTLLMNVGETQFFERKFADARLTYQQSIPLAKKLKDRQQFIYATNNLAKLAILRDDWAEARRQNDAGAEDEISLGDHDSQIFSNLYAGQIALGLNQQKEAKDFLNRVVSSPDASAPLKAESLESLAQLHDRAGETKEAEKSYRLGINFMDKARRELGRTEFQLSYPIFAESIYDDYVHSLIRRRMTERALNVVEDHKASTLIASTGADTRPRDKAASSNAMSQITAPGHIILSYWLGKGTSYVWAIGRGGTHMAPLPDQDQIAAAVKRYQSRLTSSFGTNDSGAGQELYRMLVEPVKQWIPPAASITIIPDGALCSLNFETLVVPEPKPHYWIEDVAVHEASSLSLLEHRSKTAAKMPSGTPALLVVGDPKTPVSYPELSHAHAEVDAVAKHFPREQEAVLTGAAATPTAYFAARPENYDVIHFVAHGTASRLSPLDSAVVLSDDGKSYNLFARQIMDHPLHSRLVTISSCDSAGGRIYSAEGLVGMSWAFLRAGAHEVVAALWQVNDASTPRFMDAFYAEVAQGRDPADALRDAKLAMLHSGTIYAKPFYWAPFVLYEGH